MEQYVGLDGVDAVPTPERTVDPAVISVGAPRELAQPPAIREQCLKIMEAELVGRGHADVRVSMRTCGETFEQHESVAEHEAAKPKCPKCGSDKVERAVSTFYAQTSKKS